VGIVAAGLGARLVMLRAQGKRAAIPPTTAERHPSPGDAISPAADAAPAPPEAVPPPVIPRLYSEDEDESLDPTRIGEFVSTSADDDDEADGDGSTEPAPVHRLVHDPEAEEDEPTRVQSFFLLFAMAQTDKGL